MNTRPDALVEAARMGSREALEKLVRSIQDPIHRLAMRTLVNSEDARDATQEILIIVVTKLATFEGRSTFMTWVYSIAANHLTTARKVRDRDPRLTFDTFREDLHDGLADDAAASAEDHVLLNELRFSCTMAMLFCLDLDHRIAYVFGEILEFEHGEAAEALGISKVNFRQRLSRARTQINASTAEICGLANPSAKCSCPRRLPAAIRLGRVGRSGRESLIRGAPSYEDARRRAQAVAHELKAVTLQRTGPDLNSPEDFSARIAAIVGPA